MIHPCFWQRHLTNQNTTRLPHIIFHECIGAAIQSNPIHRSLCKRGHCDGWAGSGARPEAHDAQGAGERKRIPCQADIPLSVNR